jgi:hypothetical protein
VITADVDLIPEDPLCYRVILADAFRRRGIYDRGWASMSPDSLRWEAPDHVFQQAKFDNLLYTLDLMPEFDRETIAEQEKYNRRIIHDWFMADDDSTASTKYDWETLLGIKYGNPELGSIHRNADGRAAIEVHSARIARRTGPTGRQSRELLIELTQKRAGYFDTNEQAAAEADPTYAAGHPFDFVMRGGSTLIIDLTDGSLRYTIRKRIDDQKRLQRLREWWLSIRDLSLEATYFGIQKMSEPFALAHRS